MTEDSTREDVQDVSKAEVSDADIQAVTSSYKVLGQLTSDGGVGVLGQNDAGSGTPIGVQGVVPNATSAGYGLYTPHDAKVEGVTEVATLAGSLTGNTPVGNLTGNKITIDGTGNLNWAGTYRTRGFSGGGTAWTPVSGLSSETPVEVRFDTSNQTRGRMRLDVDGTFEQYSGTGDIVTRLVGPSSSLTLASENYFGEEKSLDVSASATDARGIAFKGDGGKLYVLDNGSDDVLSYSLSTNWEIDTATQDNQFDVSGQDTLPLSLAFKSDGTKMFVAGEANENVYSYTLSTAWDITTASFLRSLNISSEESSVKALTFKDDGSKLYISGPGSDGVLSYALSTSWDLGTASYTGNKLDLSFISGRLNGLAFTDSGAKLFVAEITSDIIYEFNLSTPWDVTTAQEVYRLELPSGTINPTDLTFKDDESKLYYPNADEMVFQFAKDFQGSVYAAVAME